MHWDLKKKGTSIPGNDIWVAASAMRHGLTLFTRGHPVVHHGLEHLAGTWDKKDYREFLKNVEDVEKTDETRRK